MRHGENHKVQHLGWLRAAVLGANDGIISTASLMMGIAAAQTSAHAVLVAGVAALVAGSLSMAAGEYVSVRSQADTEAADIKRETQELADHPAAELRELTEIYVARGLTRELAQQVATQLTAHDALGAHARDELGIIEFLQAKPLQAALTSAATFAVGALIPLLVILLLPVQYLIPSIALSSLLALALLGGLAANVGGASKIKGALRVCTWGAIAMGLTGFVGHIFGVQVSMRQRPSIINGIDRLVLFDGVCNLCNRNMLFLIRHDSRLRLKFCSVQSSAGQEILAWLGLPVDTHESILLLDGETLYEKSDAVLHIASHLSWRLRWLYVGKILPRVLRDNLYLWVARNRYKLMGRKEVCAMPSPEISSRFISTTD